MAVAHSLLVFLYEGSDMPRDSEMSARLCAEPRVTTAAFGLGVPR